MYNKKGVSAIVATVLIILITVAAVTIFWASIVPMINYQLDTGLVCLDAVQQITLVDSGYTCLNNDTLSVQIKHGREPVDLVDIQVLASVNGTTTSYFLMNDSDDVSSVDDLPGVNEVKTYTIDGVDKDMSSVEIAPVLATGATTKICDVTSIVNIRSC
jgi:flagellin-like protein